MARIVFIGSDDIAVARETLDRVTRIYEEWTAHRARSDDEQVRKNATAISEHSLKLITAISFGNADKVVAVIDGAPDWVRAHWPSGLLRPLGEKYGRDWHLGGV